MPHTTLNTVKMLKESGKQKIDPCFTLNFAVTECLCNRVRDSSIDFIGCSIFDEYSRYNTQVESDLYKVRRMDSVGQGLLSSARRFAPPNATTQSEHIFRIACLHLKKVSVEEIFPSMGTTTVN